LIAYSYRHEEGDSGVVVICIAASFIGFTAKTLITGASGAGTTILTGVIGTDLRFCATLKTADKILVFITRNALIITTDLSHRTAQIATDECTITRGCTSCIRTVFPICTAGAKATNPSIAI
jgi:hypothetical protein